MGLSVDSVLEGQKLLITKGYPEQDISPIIHLGLENDEIDDNKAKRLLALISRECLSRGIYIPNAKYTTLIQNVPPPTLRLTVNASHTKAEIDQAVDILIDVCTKILTN